MAILKIDWWVKVVMVIWNLNVWCFKKIEFLDESSFDVDF